MKSDTIRINGWGKMGMVASELQHKAMVKDARKCRNVAKGLIELNAMEVLNNMIEKYEGIIPEVGRFNTGLLMGDERLAKENLVSIANKIEGHMLKSVPVQDRLHSVAVPNNSQVVVNNNINIHVTVESTIQAIQENGSLPQKDIEEIITKIRELEEIANSEETRAQKWDRAGKVINWTATVGVDTAMRILPLVMKLFGQN